jgi:thymidylate synthase (FAD)
MNVINQSYKVIVWPTFHLVERSARICYQSESKSDDTSGEEFTAKLIKREHMAMIEFAHMAVKFITDRGVSHELVRHRLCSFAQESTRYCDYGGNVIFIRPSTFDSWDDAAQLDWRNAMLYAENSYRAMREKGLSPQQARSVLPNSTKTEIMVDANIREWLHIFKLRCAKAAHPDMQALMTPLRNEVFAAFPFLQ